MKVIKNEKVIPYDVDKTLILFDNMYEAVPDAIEMMYGGRKVYVKPSEEHIGLLRHHKERGYIILVWSANGFQWASEVVERLGLSDVVDLVMTKPQEYVDDKDVHEWMCNRIYLEKV